MIRLMFIFAIWFAPWPAAAQSVMNNSDTPQQSRGFTTTNPDPTAAVTARLEEVAKTIRELMQQSDDGLKQLFLTELKAINEKVNNAVDIRNSRLDALQDETTLRFQEMKDLTAERFNRVDAEFDNVEGQFQSVDKNVDTALKVTQTTANDALTATKEAVATAAIVTKDQITQQGEVQKSEINGLRIGLDELRRRSDVLEGRTSGLGEAKDTLGGNVGMFIGVGGVLIAGIGLLLAMNRRAEPHPQQQQMLLLLQQIASQLGQQQQQVRYVQVAPSVSPPGVTTTTNTVPG